MGEPVILQINPFTRQWYLLRRLESLRGATLEELARSLPDDFPKHLRTIRRDLAAVEAALPPQGLAFVREMQGFFSIGLGPPQDLQTAPGHH
jgi:hypothetical protein